MQNEFRESLARDALAAWEAFEGDGLHLTLEEADAWLERVEAGEDVEPPSATPEVRKTHI